METRQYTLGEVLDLMDVPVSDGTSGREDRDGSFHDTPDMPTAARLARYGDQETLDRIDRLARRAFVQGQMEEAEGFNIVSAPWGSWVDVGDYLAGAPDCMRDVAISEGARVIDIAVDLSASANVSKEDMAARGEKILRLVRALELNGWSVGLTVMSRTRSCYDKRHNIEVILKRSGEYLSPSIAAFFLGRSSGFRRAFFRLMEDQPDQVRQDFGFHDRSNYGYPVRGGSCWEPEKSRLLIGDFGGDPDPLSTCVRILAKQNIFINP